MGSRLLPGNVVIAVQAIGQPRLHARKLSGIDFHFSSVGIPVLLAALRDTGALFFQLNIILVHINKIGNIKIRFTADDWGRLFVIHLRGACLVARS